MRTAQYCSIQYDTGVATWPHTILTSMESGCVRRTEAKLYWESMDANRTVLFITVRYRCRHLATYRAVPVSLPRRTPYRPVQNPAAHGEQKLNHTGIVRMCTAQYRSSRYDTGVAAGPCTVQYQCRRLAAHCTDLYRIWQHAVNRSQTRLG